MTNVDSKIGYILVGALQMAVNGQYPKCYIKYFTATGANNNKNYK
jgi:hypothetical protein